MTAPRLEGSAAEPAVVLDAPAHKTAPVQAAKRPGKRPTRGATVAVAAPEEVPPAQVAPLTPFARLPHVAPLFLEGPSEFALPGPPPRPAAISRTTPGFDYQPLVAESKRSTGVERLDLLLGGGYGSSCATLLFGPPFCGKQQLQQRAIVRAAADGVPVTLLLHTIGAGAMSHRLRALDPRFMEAEKNGLVRYIDVHSRSLGERTDHPNAAYIDDPHDVGQILSALEPGRDAHVPGPGGLLAVESASSLLMDLGTAKAFTVLRRALGRTLTAGGVGLVCLEGGMHAESEVQMAKHLCAGMIEMRKKGEAYCLHVEGLETAFPRPGWIEYEFTSKAFRVTGSFASRTIA